MVLFLLSRGFALVILLPACLFLGSSKGRKAFTGSLKATINGMVSHITAIFGFTLAGLVIQSIVDEEIRTITEIK